MRHAAGWAGLLHADSGPAWAPGTPGMVSEVRRHLLTLVIAAVILAGASGSAGAVAMRTSDRTTGETTVTSVLGAAAAVVLPAAFDQFERSTTRDKSRLLSDLILAALLTAVATAPPVLIRSLGPDTSRARRIDRARSLPVRAPPFPRVLTA